MVPLKHPGTAREMAEIANNMDYIAIHPGKSH
jgi:hypothetical protein